VAEVLAELEQVRRRAVADDVRARAELGREQQRDARRVVDEQAVGALLHRDAGAVEPLAHGVALRGAVEHERPVAQAGDGLRRRRRRDALAAPGVEAHVVVVAGDRHEHRVGHRGHDLEADRVLVEAPRGGDVVHVQVEVADDRAGVGVPDGLGVAERPEEAVEVERVRAAERLERRPRLARAVGGELDAVAVGVGEVDRLGDAVVGRRPRSACGVTARRCSARASSSRLGVSRAKW
jgi:hypothetical protein